MAELQISRDLCGVLTPVTSWKERKRSGIAALNAAPLVHCCSAVSVLGDDINLRLPVASI
ncbi:hypothetical protein [Catellatospora paridis]|uniref:hypothetical protein n=1 Tax=Catellatospora paridis TaxID=1617086 RepID=UPI0012D38CFF|nr:hypothetical protein [Catellatospora paridis]